MRPGLPLLVLSLSMGLLVSCARSGPQKQVGPASPPRSTPAAGPTGQPTLPQTPPSDKPQEPLLLLDERPEARAAAGAGADNSRCLVCHLNFEAEKLTQVHARAQIGCEKCHGASDAHIADESWASGGNGTPPDTMFTKAQVNPFCLGCHARDKIEHEGHKAFLAGTSPEKHCTDCHGQHRLISRRCKWK